MHLLMWPLSAVPSEVTGFPHCQHAGRPFRRHLGGVDSISAGSLVTSHSLTGGPAAAFLPLASKFMMTITGAFTLFAAWPTA
jgi:hypothetical protein